MKTENLVAIIRKVLKNYKEIRVAYLFGSTAKKKESNLSDIDIGIYLDPKLPQKRQTDLILEIASELEKALKKRVDVVVMNKASPSLNFEIIKCNTPIITMSKIEKVKLEHKIMQKYLDRRYYDQRFFELFEKRIKSFGLK